MEDLLKDTDFTHMLFCINKTAFSIKTEYSKEREPFIYRKNKIA